MRRWLLVSCFGLTLYTLTALPALAISSEEATKAVTRAYQDILGREPDKEGLRIYRSKMVDDGWSEKQVRNTLKKSLENKSEDVDAIIKRAYQDILGRDPDKEGLKNYRHKMQEEGWSEKKLRETLRKSSEAKKSD